MRFLLDANLPRMAVPLMTSLGYEANAARDLGLGDATDAQIAAYACKTSAAIVTRDLDFADVRNYPPEDYFGILVIRLPDDTIARDIARVLERFFSQKQLVERIKGRLVIVESDRVRFRPKLVDLGY